MSDFALDFTPAVYNDFLKGLIAKKKAGFSDTKDEFHHLIGLLKHFSLDREPVAWSRLADEISYYEKECTFEKAQEALKVLLVANERQASYLVFSPKYKGEADQECVLQNKKVLGEPIHSGPVLMSHVRN